MFLVISKDSSKYQNDNYVILNSICELKYLKGEYDLIIDDLIVDKDGFIEENKMYLEEVLVSVAVNNIYTNNPSDKLKEICSFYKIPILHNT